MIQLNKIVNRLVKHSKKIQKREDCNLGKFRIFVDIALCRLQYGINGTEYKCLKFYKYNSPTRRTFITMRKNVELDKKFNTSSAIEICDSKPLFNEIFKKYIKREWIDCRTSEIAAIESFIKKFDTVIVKPVDLYYGLGIFKLSYKEERKYFEFIESLRINKKFIIEEIVENSNEIKILNPSSLNTFRVVTCIDNKDDLHIIKIALRIGSGDSCVDNAAAGGIVCSVNTESGIIEGKGIAENGMEYNIHPKTKIQIVGYKIPNIEKLIAFVNEICRENREMRYVGWDIADTRNGFELIECNIRPAAEVTQMGDHIGRYLQLKKMI